MFIGLRTVGLGVVAAALAFSSGCAGLQPVKSPPPSPAAVVAPPASGVVIDGKLDDAVWQTAPAYALGFDAGTAAGGRGVTEPGQVQFASDATTLYVAFRCEDADVMARGGGDEKQLYLTGDLAEMFLAVEGRETYWELHLTPTGQTRAFVIPSHGYIGLRDPLSAALALQGATQVDGTLNDWTDRDRGWTAEMAIPLDQLVGADGTPAPRGRLRVLAGRYNYGRQLISPETTMHPVMPIIWFHMTDRYAPLRLTFSGVRAAQQPPYDTPPPADAPYYRVRYEASTKEGELIYPVTYTLWVPNDVKTLRGVIVHQHGCGEGSCKSGQTGAYDLHWQALAKKYDCALMSPSYEQPEKASCWLWYDPRNGSDVAFQKSLSDLGSKSGHPELATVPWALWGHSGGGYWAGSMVLLHPERVAAAWLRSGVPPVKAAEGNPAPYAISDAACQVPVMCNLGTKEGVTVKDGEFGGVWAANEVFFREMRSKGSLIGVSVDPNSSHDCNNQRYLAIPWFDACLGARLGNGGDTKLKAMPTEGAYLAPLLGDAAQPAAKFSGDVKAAIWLPNERVAKAWAEYVKDGNVSDATPPPAPINVQHANNTLTWQAEADFESGIAGFIIERDGKELARVPETPTDPSGRPIFQKNGYWVVLAAPSPGVLPIGRPIFQNNGYSDSPTPPLAEMKYTDTTARPGENHTYRVFTVNSVGLKSEATPGL